MPTDVSQLLEFIGVTAIVVLAMLLATKLGRDAVAAERGWQSHLIKTEQLGSKFKNKANRYGRF